VFIEGASAIQLKKNVISLEKAVDPYLKNRKEDVNVKSCF
jgi:hypothetical protein